MAFPALPRKAKSSKCPTTAYSLAAGCRCRSTTCSCRGAILLPPRPLLDILRQLVRHVVLGDGGEKTKASPITSRSDTPPPHLLGDRGWAALDQASPDPQPTQACAMFCARTDARQRQTPALFPAVPAVIPAVEARQLPASDVGKDGRSCSPVRVYTIPCRDSIPNGSA